MKLAAIASITAWLFTHGADVAVMSFAAGAVSLKVWQVVRR